MPKNKGRGGKNRKKGKNENLNIKREIIFKEEGTEYAQVIKMLGNGRLEARCFDGVKRLGHIRGKMRKKVWIGVDDIVLVALREFQNDKCDVILKYLPDEVRNLKAYGELPESITVNEESEPTGDVVIFDEGDSGSDEDSDGSESGVKPLNKKKAPAKKEEEKSDSEDDDIDDGLWSPASCPTPLAKEFIKSEKINSISTETGAIICWLSLEKQVKKKKVPHI